MFHSEKRPMPKPIPVPAPATHGVDKAGYIIFGWDKDDKGYRRLYLLSSYSEGRFEPNIKAPHLPKGGVNLHRGESVEDAASRETREETGLNVKRLERGGYRGLIIEQHHPDIAGCYVSSTGHEKQLVYKVIELKEGCIRRLGKNADLKLKGHRENRLPTPCVKVSAAKLAAKAGLPDLPTMIETYRTGNLPKIGNRRARKGVLREPALPEIAMRYGLPEKPTEEQWIAFNYTVSTQGTSDEQRRLLADYKKVKKALEGRYLGDKSGLKQATSDCPGRIFQEGGEVLPVEDFLRRSVSLSHKNDLYAKGAWGLQFEHGQLEALVDFFTKIAPMSVYAATTDFKREKLPENHIDLAAVTASAPANGMPEWIENHPHQTPDFLSRSEAHQHQRALASHVARHCNVPVAASLMSPHAQKELLLRESILAADLPEIIEPPVRIITERMREKAQATIDSEDWRHKVEAIVAKRVPGSAEDRNRG